MTTDSRHRDLLRERLSEVCARHAERVLVADKKVALTGADLERAQTRWLEAAACRIPEGGYVGVRLPPSAAQAAAVLTVMASGRVPVMLDAWAPSPPRLDFLHGLVCSEDAAEYPEIHGPIVGLDRYGQVVESRSGRAPKEPPLAQEAAGLVLYTSGSGGEPKGVILPSAGLLYVAGLLIERLRLDADTQTAVTLPLHHTMGLNTQFLPTVLAGGRALVLATRLGLGRAYRDILESGATFAALFPDVLGALAIEKERRGLAPAASVTHLQLAGAPIRTRHLETARELFPAARLHKGYGLTEAIRVTMIDDRDPYFPEVGAGRPLEGQDVSIRDRDGLRVECGESGEVWVRGPNVMLGYLHGDEALPRGGWLRTGDLGSLTADGRLVVEGRRDRLFKCHGRHVSPSEIEDAALSSPLVAGAGCIPVACPVRGRRPILFVELVGSLTGGLKSEIETALLGRLQPHRVPRDVVVLDAIPRSAAGKLDVVALEGLWRRPPGRTELGRGPAGCRFTTFGTEEGA